MQIVELGAQGLIDYLQVPSTYVVRERYRIVDNKLDGPVPEFSQWLKDYDAYIDDRPDRYPDRFDVSTWGVFAAVTNERRVGGLVLAHSTASFDQLEGRSDLAFVMDLRVHPDEHRRGFGSALWSFAEDWASTRGVTEIRVESQDINVRACRFYLSMGCVVHSTNAAAYPPELEETQIIWSKLLAAQ